MDISSVMGEQERNPQVQRGLGDFSLEPNYLLCKRTRIEERVVWWSTIVAIVTLVFLPVPRWPRPRRPNMFTVF